MDELNNYNSTPEHCDDKDNTGDDDDEDYSLKSEEQSDKTESPKSVSPRKTEQLSSENAPLLTKSASSIAAPTVVKHIRSPESLREFAERSLYIPLRLTEDERRYGALSSYFSTQTALVPEHNGERFACV